MVSAKLLADVDLKMREVVRRIRTMKSDPAGEDRAFGGMSSSQATSGGWTHPAVVFWPTFQRSLSNEHINMTPHQQ
jgi:hypothetical protein